MSPLDNVLPPAIWILAAALLLHVAHTWYRALHRGREARQSHEVAVAPAGSSSEYVSVLIPAWNEAQTIEPCLQSLSQVDYPNWEVIVIAGGVDGTYEILKGFTAPGYNLALIRQANAGKNVALNQGLARAKGDVVAILDADCVVSSDWLASLVGTLSETVEATTGNYYPLDYSWVSCSEQMEKISAYQVRGSPILQGSGSIAIRREALDAVGGFPRDVLAGVDWDLNIRLSERAMSRAFAPGAQVHTHRPTSLREFWHNEVRWRRAHIGSIGYHRDYYLRSWQAASNGMLFYATALAGSTLILLLMASLLLAPPTVSFYLGACTLLFLLWMAGRRAALAAEVSGYTLDHSWLKLAWAPAVLLFASVLASWWALLTLGRQTAHFKGPRSQPTA